MFRIDAIQSKLSLSVLAVALSALALACGESQQAATDAPDQSAVDDVVENAIEPLSDEDLDAPTDSSGDYSVEFIQGAPIPPDFPKDLPLPEGAELVGAFDNELSEAIELSVPGDPKELLGSMESNYLDQGWDVTGAETNARGEAMILATKGGRSVMTLIEPGSGGNSVVKTIAIEGTLEE